jgi:hypothetical protein
MIIKIIILILFTLPSFSMYEPLEMTPSSSGTYVAQKDHIEMVELSEQDDIAISTENNNPFRKAVLKCLLHDENINQHSSQNKYFKYLTYFIWGNSGIPLIEPAFNAARGVNWLGYIFGGATFITIGTSRVWTINEVFKELEVENNPASSRHISTFRHFGCHVLGILSSLPFTYATYKFNKIKYFCIITFFSEYGLGTYAYYNVLNENTVKNLKNSFTGKKPDNKKLILTLIEDLPEKLLSIEEENQIVLIDSLLQSKDEKELFSKIIQIFKGENILHHTPTRRERIQSAIKYLGFLIPLSNLVRSSILAYQSTALVYDSPYFAIPYTFVTVLPGFAIDLIATNQTFDSLFKLTPNKQKPRKSLMRNNYPNAFLAAFLASVIIPSLAGTSNWFITFNTLEDSEFDNYQYFFSITNLIGFITFEAYAMYSIFSNLAEYHTHFHGSQQNKKYTNFTHLLQRLKNVINIFPEENFSNLELFSHSLHGTTHSPLTNQESI